MTQPISNEEIMAGFEELFADESTEESEEIEEETEETEEVETEESEEDEGTEESEEDSEEESEEDKPEDNPEDKQKKKQNFEFARMRTENKKQAALLKKMGKVLGMDPKATPDQIAERFEQALLEKEAKEKNVPVELLQRLQELESIAAENTRVKIENETHKAFTDLAEKYNLDSDALTEFATHLAQNGKNPLDGVEVDIESEYIKLHHADIVKAAVDAALAEEGKRKKKVEDHASSRTPGSSTDPGEGGTKIETVADLDKYFASL